MMDGRATIPSEIARLASLERYGILDTPPEAAFDKITALVRTVLGVPMAAVSLIDQHRQWFKSRQGLEMQEMPREVSFCSHTICRREPMIVEDAIRDTRFKDNPLVLGKPFIRSYAGVPLRTPGGYNVGALCAIDTVPRVFDATQIALLASFADLVVDELELRLIAQADYLTGAMTRRAFVVELDKAFGRHRRGAERAVLVSLDIDRFKSINDTLGHAVGDMVLVNLAAALSREMRASDAFGRIGGEEFGILLPNIGIDRALLAAERFRAVIAALRFDGFPDLRVTSSFGLAAIDHGVADVTEWLARADRALYAAKQGGRNQCCVASE